MSLTSIAKERIKRWRGPGGADHRLEVRHLHIEPVALDAVRDAHQLPGDRRRGRSLRSSSVIRRPAKLLRRSALIRCTVPVPTPKRAAILCMPASPFDSAARMAFSVAGAIFGRSAVLKRRTLNRFSLPEECCTQL
jgi:hypothetical protein